MNLSLKEIFLWLIALDFPSISAIGTWLVNVPWWLAILTMYISWLLARAAWALAWNFYSWLTDQAYIQGQRCYRWFIVGRQTLRQISTMARSITSWLLAIFAIR